MGAGCCKTIELNPDGNPKEPQTKEQKKEDPKELHRLAAAADWSQMRLLLRRMPLKHICSGAERDEVTDDELGNTALHFSVSINHLRGIKKLLRYGIPPAIQNKAGKTPLHLALETGKLKAARILLEKSMMPRAAASRKSAYLVNLKDTKGVTPLLAVVAAGRLKLTREVLTMCKELDVGINFDVRDEEGNSLLLYAAKWGWFDELEAWTDNVHVPRNLLNLQNKQGETVLGHVLMFAASGLLAKARALQLATKMLGLGALPQLPAFRERVPLINLAVAADDKSMYDILALKGADPTSCRDALGRTGLHYAAAKGSRVLGAKLLDAGLKPYALDGQRNTPLHLAAMRGQEALVELLLEKADDKLKALLTPNKSGLSAYHLALKSGPDDRAQSNSMSLIEQLGDMFTTPVIGARKAVVDTPLLLAIQGHQDKVVRVLLQKGCSPNEANSLGEVPLARVLRSATAVTYDNDSSIFDQLIGAGADMASAGETAHPMLAICKNNMSTFAENAVRVLTERCGTLDWNKRDDKGYTPLALAAFHDNAWLVRYLLDEVKIDPNADAQRSSSTAPEQVGTTGSLCCTKPITVPGTVPEQTPLMCAAKGVSIAAVQLLLNRKANVNAVDSQGRTALQHAMHLDKAASLKVAAALLQMGARPDRGVLITRRDGTKAWTQCVDLVGESWPHRAVRYGFSAFLGLWAGCGGSLELLATTADDADDMPGAELKVEDKADFLDFAPRQVNNPLDNEDEELVDEYNGEDSEEVAAAAEDNEGDAATDVADPGAVAEGVERGHRRRVPNSDSSDDDCGEDEELAGLIASGEVESFYAGPTPRMMLRWRRRGMRWWDEFWVDRDSLPDIDLEDEPHWEDKYNVCEEGDECIDEEDVEDEIWEAINAEQRSVASAMRRSSQEEPDEDRETVLGAGASGDSQGGGTPELVSLVSSGFVHKLFRRRLPSAVVPETADADDGTFAAGSPSKWLRRKSITSLPSSPAVVGAGAAPLAPSPSESPDIGVATSGHEAAGLHSKSNPASTRKAAGPVAESRGDVEVEDLDDTVLQAVAPDTRQSSRSQEDDERTPLLEGRLTTSDMQRAKSRSSSMHSQGIREATPEDAGDERLRLREPEVPLAASKSGRSFRFQDDVKAGDTDEDERAPLLNRGSLRSMSSRVMSRLPSESAPSERSKSFRQSMSAVGGKLVSGVSGEKLYANEPFYQEGSRYNGLPRYMMVETFELPEETYEGHLDTFMARVHSYVIKEDKLLEGPELRARNIGWYHKSMSPVEYPQKIGKWKSFLRLGTKAAEEAKLRGPRGPGEKPKIRSKKAWFGLPNLPSRPELALTSPLVYAVRLGRAKCVEVLLKYSGALPNIPDAHGITPLSYAMFMLAKERNNKVVQQIADMILNAQPLVDSATVWRLMMLPRVKDELQQMEADAAAKGGDAALGRRSRKALQEKREMVTFLSANYSARYFPSVMEPVILAALLNDIGRLTFMVRKCGANINAAWVWLPDIPTYFRGLWEKQLRRCNSRCTALHIAICQKKYDSVRALLDLGSDPNMAGAEFSGSYKKDMAKQAKLFLDKAKEGKRLKDAGSRYNQYAKLWQDMKSSLRDMFYSTKRFLSSIEIPGIGRPHPWLSPLHLSCRFGLPEITFLLIQRGAASNGGPASAFAPKSPLEEALLYARANAQAYGTTSERHNYHYILEEACLEETDNNKQRIKAAMSYQKAQRAEMVEKVKGKAQQLSDNSPRDKKGKPSKSPDDFMKQANKVIKAGGRLAFYDPESLRDVPIPGMNATALAKKGLGYVKDALGMMDPLKATIKAVTLAAKIIVKLLLEMMRRPIAQYDPAMACAHVMLYFRAPINLTEKQTGILMRDILDNGNGLEGADTRMSYYRWLSIEPEHVNDMAWVETVINKVRILKCNIDYGFMQMDLTTKWKDYERYKKKFMSQVQSAVLNYGSARLMPQYLKHVIDEGVSLDGQSDAASARTLDSWFNVYIETAMEKKQALFNEYKKLPKAEREDWVNRRNMGVVPSEPVEYDIAKELLPQWLQTAPDAASPTEAADAARPTAAIVSMPETVGGIKTFLIRRFLGYDPDTQKAIVFAKPPVGPSVWDQMLASQDDITFDWPAIPKEEVDAMRPTISDVTDADVCFAVVRAYNATVVKKAKEHSEKLQKRSAALAQEAAQHFMSYLTARAEDKSGCMAQVLVERQQPVDFDEEPIFKAAVEEPRWEAAVNKLGGSAVAKQLVGRLRAAQAAGEIPAIPDPLEFAKSLGQQALEQGREALIEKMEAQLGQPFTARLRSALAGSIPAGEGGNTQQPEEGRRRSADTIIDDAANNVMDVVDAAREADNYLELAKNEFGPECAAMLKALQEACAGGKFPIPDPEMLAKNLADGVIELGPDAVIHVWESKTGLPLPEAVRKEVEKGAKQFSERVMQKYEESGLSAAIGACTIIAAGVAVSVSAGLLDAAEDKVDELMATVEEVVDTVEAVIDGDLELADALSEVSPDLLLVLPMPKKLADATAPLTNAMKEANEMLAALGNTSKQLEESMKALTGQVAADVEGMAKTLADSSAEVYATLSTELEEASDQFMAGFELMLEVDTQALVDAIEDAREVLVMILELLQINDLV